MEFLQTETVKQTSFCCLTSTGYFFQSSKLEDHSLHSRRFQKSPRRERNCQRMLNPSPLLPIFLLTLVRLFDLFACMVKERKRLLRRPGDQTFLRAAGEKKRKGGHKRTNASLFRFLLFPPPHPPPTPPP